MYSIDTPDLNACFNEADAVPSSVSSGFLHLVSTVCDASGLEFARSIKSHKLWDQARTVLLPVPQAGKMSASKPVFTFPVIQLYLDSGLLCHLIISL